MDLYYAHSANSRGQRQGLSDHLEAVSRLTAQFASGFGAAEIGRYVGLVHDAGKYNPAFREYLLKCEADPKATGHGPDHKAAGAALAARCAPPLALLVQGHHGGLHSPSDLKNWLDEKGHDPAIAQAIETAVSVLPGLTPKAPVTAPSGIAGALGHEFFFRMLFSALVDADCLDTEGHFEPDRADLRGSSVTIEELWHRFQADQAGIPHTGGGAVGAVRREVYQACLDAATGPTGLYRLTVPTGGGKTRSGMAFALRHAVEHGLDRVIVAVPFLSITEQTAAVYRSIFEPESNSNDSRVILEHHTGIVEDKARADDWGSSEDYHQAGLWRRLAAQDWDAPIIITTTVQLFQSLFANRTSACRKLHRLARSVIILDEAQTLPPKLLEPILDGLKTLCADYGATVVLSTATQPAFDAIPLFAGVPSHEIVPEPARHFAALKRVRFDWRTRTPMAWDEVAHLMRSEAAVLTVVNTKKDALALLRALDDPDALHLSTSLCGAHRRRVIAEIKTRLQAGDPCRVVSTQVVEAGVNLDFPLVMRALGPLDSIIQVAGRCNREGLLEEGLVIVFLPAEGSLPPGAYRTAVEITGMLLDRADLDPNDPAVVHDYFDRLFNFSALDAREIQQCRTRLDYPAVAERFRMIDDDTESVVVAYGLLEERQAVERALDQLRRGAPNSRRLYAALQPYVVNIRTREANRCRHAGWIMPVVDGMGEWAGEYDARLGLLQQDPDPSLLVL